MILESVPREVLALALAVVLVLALGQAVLHAGRTWLRRRRMSLRMKRAALGEQRAAGLLRDHGFAVLGSQVEVEHVVTIDHRRVVIALRADYLGEKDGLRYVVEVKTGAHAPRIETSATRRQILEYRVAFDVDGVVLVDAESGGVHEVTFPALSRLALPAPNPWRFVALGLAATATALAILRFV